MHHREGEGDARSREREDAPSREGDAPSRRETLTGPSSGNATDEKAKTENEYMRINIRDTTRTHKRYDTHTYDTHRHGGGGEGKGGGGEGEGGEGEGGDTPSRCF